MHIPAIIIIINIGNKVILMLKYKIYNYIEPNYATIKSFFFTLYFKILSATGSFINIFNQATSIDKMSMYSNGLYILSYI